MPEFVLVGGERRLVAGIVLLHAAQLLLQRVRQVGQVQLGARVELEKLKSTAAR